MSQLMFDPAAIIMASTPQTMAPSSCQATMGNVPAVAALCGDGPVGAGTHVEEGAGAECELGQPLQNAALPDERRLLVADDPGYRRGSRAKR